MSPPLPPLEEVLKRVDDEIDISFASARSDDSIIISLNTAITKRIYAINPKIKPYEFSIDMDVLCNKITFPWDENRHKYAKELAEHQHQYEAQPSRAYYHYGEMAYYTSKLAEYEKKEQAFEKDKAELVNQLKTSLYPFAMEIKKENPYAQLIFLMNGDEKLEHLISANLTTIVRKRIINWKNYSSEDIKKILDNISGYEKTK
ncbi:MAG: hypothetical protein PHU51_04675 [Candidatus Nanoarchaeia archaeon]|nr:hypothetical protein [Candidatus Nanoarchaeia archaeon]